MRGLTKKAKHGSMRDSVITRFGILFKMCFKHVLRRLSLGRMNSIPVDVLKMRTLQKEVEIQGSGAARDVRLVLVYPENYDLAMELQVPTENNSDGLNRPQGDETGKIDPTFAGIAKGVEEVIQILKIME
ncbi:hypothetical protein L1887_11478 [Cichorium endivia]|nr:hypothetical protein L1887_11478 [Cichorium endivia]